MKFRRQFILKIKERRGAVLIIVALIMVVLIGFAALAIDVGYLYATKNELQNIADGAALAAAGELGNKLYNGETLNDTAITAIKDVAKEIGEKNQAGGKADIDIIYSDVKIGRWKDPDLNPNGLFETSDSPNAVQVTARRDGLANNSVGTFFGGILGVDSVGVNADATAALSGPLEMKPGIPVGISLKWFEKPEFCDQPIKFHPTGTLEGCAGWHNYYDPDDPEKGNANARKLRDILDGLNDGSFEIPKTVAGVTKYAFIGGTVASAFSNIEALYTAKKGNCGDNSKETWCVNIVVYDRDDCSNPNKSITIVGFAPTIITGIYGPPQKTIEAEVQCDKAVLSRGGSPYYGVWASIPHLVE
jgi:Flp pilus assembly protein TadG